MKKQKSCLSNKNRKKVAKYMKEDLRVIKTKENIKKSMLHLLKKYAFKDITMSMLVDECRINKTTFYRHYSDKYDLIEKISKDYISLFSKASSNFENGINVHNIDCLIQFFDDNKDESFKNETKVNKKVIFIIAIILLIIIAPYRMDRISAFINPWKDELGTGFQIIQSLYAIGPGGLLGSGYLNSIQKNFYLPEPQTDFIFSIICEEFGVVGAIIIVLLFSILFYRGILIATKTDDLFSKYLAFGITFQLLFQTIMNLCVVVGLIPVTGVTLPFISYGGSSLLISMASMGILLNISRK